MAKRFELKIQTEIATLENQTSVIRTFIDDEWVEAFLKETDIKDSSKSTYRRALKQFFLFISNRVIEQLSDGDIMSYKTSLKELKLAAYTITNYLVVVRRFFAWAESKKLYPNIARNIKGMKRPKGFRKECLTIQQTKDVIDEIDCNTLQGKRDFAIINILLRTGLRTIELQRADIGDVTQSGGEAKLYIQGKGRDTKDEFVLLTHTTLKSLREYLNYRTNADDSEPLFASISDRNSGKRMTTRSISRIAKNALINAGLDSNKLTAHSLRHTAITTALLAGASLQEVKGMARHSDINTTLIYSHNIDRVANAPERKIDEYLERLYR